MKSRIMYMECKRDSMNARGRIGRVFFSKTGRTLRYAGKEFQSLKGGYKENYYDLETGERYWISGPKRNRQDRLYWTPGIDIHDDVSKEYWISVRQSPNRALDRTT